MCYVKSKLCRNIWTQTEVICLLFMFFFKDPAPCLSYFLIILLFGIELHNMVLMARQTKVFFFFSAPGNQTRQSTCPSPEFLTPPLNGVFTNSN